MNFLDKQPFYFGRFYKQLFICLQIRQIYVVFCICLTHNKIQLSTMVKPLHFYFFQVKRIAFRLQYVCFWCVKSCKLTGKVLYIAP